MKTILTTGLHRSGTTILNLLIGGHSNCVAVGEVYEALQMDYEWVSGRLCSCHDSKCTFWKEVMQKIQPEYSTQVRYSNFLEVFQRSFPGKIPVDSSKDNRAYKILSTTTNCKVIKITRDVRGWSLSAKGNISFKSLLSWYLKNRKIDSFLPEAINVGYEPLIWNTEKVLKNICKHLNLKYEEQMKDCNGEHAILGNRFLHKNLRSIIYDGRWAPNLYISPILLPQVMSYNKNIVYGER